MKVILDDYPSEENERVVDVQIDPWDTWNADHTLSLIILPLLKEFRRTTQSYPSNLTSMEDWYMILDQMIYTFEFLANGDFDSTDDAMKVQHGLNLFAQYFRDLWD